MEKTRNILICLVLICSVLLYGHPGRTDSKGGHYNRKTGEYHYHNSGTSSYSSPAKTTTPSYSQPSNTYPATTAQRVTPSATPKPAETMPNVLPDWDDTPTPKQPVISITENFWQVALNNVLKGQMEVPVATGRVDIVTDTQVIEVDKISNYAAGIEQALKYAQATGKKATLALYIDGERDALELLQKASELCKSKNVSLLLVNSYVNVSDLITLVAIASSAKQTTNPPLATPAVNQTINQPSATPVRAIESGYWLNTGSNVRHNSACRYYMNTKNGRKCTANEGRACGTCGG